MKLVPAKCTECGAILQVDQEKDAWICDHCGMPFIVEKAIQNLTVSVVPGQAMADKLFDDAEALLSFGDYIRAEQTFRDMTQQFPRDWRGWFGEMRSRFLYSIKEGKYTTTDLTDIYEFDMAKDMELLRRALTLNPDKNAYTPFFSEVLDRVENTPNIPLPAQSLGRGYYVYTFPEHFLKVDVGTGRRCYDTIDMVGPQGSYYEPSGLLCWFVIDKGPAQMIQMLNDSDLSQRAQKLVSTFRTMYMTGAAIGNDCSFLPEFYQKAREQMTQTADPHLLCQLLKSVGIKAKYDRKAGRYSWRAPWGWKNEAHPCSYAVIGKTLIIQEHVPYSDYDNYYGFVLP